MIKTFAQSIYRNTVWIVLPISILLLFPSPEMWVGFVSALGVFLVRWIGYGLPVPPSRANLPLVVLLVMLAIGFALSPAPDLAVITAGQVVAGVTVFFVLLDQIRSGEDLKHLAVVLVILGVSFALAAPFTVNWSVNKLFGLPEFYDQLWPRLVKITNPNILAGALVPIVPICLALMAQEDIRWRIVGAVSLAPLVIILVLLQSRGALFALGAGLVLWATVHRRWVLPVILIALSVFLLFNGISGGPPFAQILYGNAQTSTPGTFVERQDIWIQSLSLIRQSPILGVGLAAFGRLAPYTWPYSPEHPGPKPDHAHDIFLQIALDTGILGLAAFVILLIFAIRSTWRAYQSGIERPLAIGTLVGLTVIIVHGLGDSAVWGAKPSMVLWMLLTIAFAFDRVKRLSKSREPSLVSDRADAVPTSQITARK